MMDNLLCQRLVTQLAAAREHRHAIERITIDHPDLTIRDAYAIQNAGIMLRQKQGQQIVGYKMGLTSIAMQQQLHVHTPIFGILMEQSHYQDGATIPLAKFIHPKAEPEIAFILDKELKGIVSMEEALNACAGVCVAIEIIDSRFKDFDFTLVDVIADNSAAGGFVLSRDIRNANQVDLSNITMTFNSNGTLLASGKSSSICGHPANSLVLLTSLLAQEGRSLPAGSIVLAGAATRAFDFTIGMTVTLEAAGLGRVSIVG